MIKNKRTIGIIGGMGPFASARLLGLVLNIAKNKFGAISGEDFPEIVLLSLPVREFLEDKSLAKEAEIFLLNRVKKLENLDVTCFGIACNTAHIFVPKIRSSTKIELISIIEETVKNLVERRVRKVGLLASPVTISSRLYQIELEKEGIEVLLPGDGEIKTLGRIIGDLISNRKVSKNRALLEKIAQKQKQKGAEVIVLGCTELPLAFPKKVGLPVIDTIEVMANSMLERCYINN